METNTSTQLIAPELEELFSKHTLSELENYDAEKDGPAPESVLIAHYFADNGYQRGDWYVAAAEKQSNGKYLFFGVVSIFCAEYGYFHQEELEALSRTTPVYRDLDFKPVTRDELGI